jgi:hypothetical protein
VETKNRANDLNDKILQTDEIIDNIVYELYGLTDEQIRVIESSAEDD